MLIPIPTGTTPPALASTSSQAHTPNARVTQDGTHIDRAYLDKIHSELNSARQTLLEREQTLARLKGDEVSENVVVVQNLTLSQHANLRTLQAEASALDTLVVSLQTEKEEISGQIQLVSGQVEARGGSLRVANVEDVEDGGEGYEVKDAEPVEDKVGDGGDAAKGNGGVNNALADISGWVDAAVRGIGRR